MLFLFLKFLITIYSNLFLLFFLFVFYFTLIIYKNIFLLSFSFILFFYFAFIIYKSYFYSIPFFVSHFISVFLFHLFFAYFIIYFLQLKTFSLHFTNCQLFCTIILLLSFIVFVFRFAIVFMYTQCCSRHLF